jgi:tetrahydromethanopterin S-methyltransferase subunit G
MDAPDGYDRLMERRLDDLEAKVDNLLAWRNWVVGIVAGVGLMIGAFAKNVADIVRHM